MILSPSSLPNLCLLSHPTLALPLAILLPSSLPSLYLISCPTLALPIAILFLSSLPSLCLLSRSALELSLLLFPSSLPSLYLLSRPTLVLPIAILFLSSLPSLSVCSAVLRWNCLSILCLSGLNLKSRTRNIGRKHLRYVATDTHAYRQTFQRKHTSVGLAQARPNYTPQWQLYSYSTCVAVIYAQWQGDYHK